MFEEWDKYREEGLRRVAKGFRVGGKPVQGRWQKGLGRWQ